MRRVLWGLLLAAIGSVAFAADNAVSFFAKPVVLRGTLGEQPVQLTLRPKIPADEGIEGDYFVFGQSQKILLAGETEDSDLLMEESENGKDVSGQWIGKFAGDAVSGEWQSADGSVSKRFVLKIVKSK
jgi:hypothetical protein